jgi:2-phosphoglycerate kinase
VHRVVLIGGTSHLGKSTLARRLAERPGLEHRSTDRLARHPGRPWPAAGRPVPPHVAEHYLGLGIEELMGSVLEHYRKLAPQIAALVRSRARDGPGLVLEGSALLPETVDGLEPGLAQAVWLVAGEGVLEARIRRESGFDAADERGRALIRRFLERARAFDGLIRAEVERLGGASLEVTRSVDEEEIAALCELTLDGEARR